MQVGWEEILSFFIFLSSHRLDSSEKRVLLNRFQELLNRRDGGSTYCRVCTLGPILTERDSGKFERYLGLSVA